MKKNLYTLAILIVLYFFSGTLVLHAQTIQLTGKVQDSLQEPLAFVNMIASPLEGEAGITFAISNKEGQYDLKLQKNVRYRLAISHLGYSRLVDTLHITQDSHKVYTLKKTTNSLEAIMIEAKIPMIVKQDTTIYRVDKFLTGEERKLRGILENLPGMEVDRDGNVTFKGKKVNTLMVEGQNFFGGNTKLGVNNIPADAVEEVVVLEDYSAVPFMKNLSDSEQIALNIKLKKGKKKFIFGDIEAGGGVKERYLVHPALFYYSQNTALNLIADFNNIGHKSFTIEDYISFEAAGIGEGFYKLYSSDFAEFLSQDDFVFQKNQFGALSLSQKLSNSLRLNAYSINSFARTETKTTTKNQYLAGQDFSESRLDTGREDLFFTLNKAELHFVPNYLTDVKYQAVVKKSTGEGQRFMSSETAQESNFTNTFTQPKDFKISQNLKLYKQFTYKHTIKANLSYTYKKSDNTKDWLFNQPIFSGIIPLMDEGTDFHLLHNTARESHVANFQLKYFRVLNNLNHLYPVIGVRYYNIAYGTLDYQKLNDGSRNTFENAGFNNELDFNFVDAYFGAEYKRKIGDLILKPGLIYHRFIVRTKQFGTEMIDLQKSVLLPKLEIEYEPQSSFKVDFNYRLSTKFGNANQYANRLRLLSFNRLYRGNENLENELYHYFRLFFISSNFFKGNLFHGGINYRHTLKSIQNETIINGVDQITTPRYVDFPSASLRFNLSYIRLAEKFDYKFLGSTSFSNYARQVNNQKENYESTNYFYELSMESDFEDSFPNFEIGWKHNLSVFGSEAGETTFQTIAPFAFLEYRFFEDFVLKADYEYDYFENKNTGDINRSQMLDASLSYWRENSLWRFKLGIENVFDVRYENTSSFGEFIISDQKIFIQPRTILFTVSYKI